MSTIQFISCISKQSTFLASTDIFRGNRRINDVEYFVSVSAHLYYLSLRGNFSALISLPRLPLIVRRVAKGAL